MNFYESQLSSPCVKICVIDPLSGHCIGCGRSIEEVALWSDLDAAQRRAIMAMAPERLAVARSRGARAGKGGGRAQSKWR